MPKLPAPVQPALLTALATLPNLLLIWVSCPWLQRLAESINGLLVGYGT
jgi:hypothetical protein